jgi:hypothetical protein
MYANQGFINDYLTKRNKKYFRGHSNIVHPLYHKELKNAISNITQFLDLTILTKAIHQRNKKLYALSAEKCFKKGSNNYTFSEAETCQDILFNRDPILTNLNDFKKEVEVRIQDQYEKTVKTGRFDEERFEHDHRLFLVRQHVIERYYYYILAKNLFTDSS